MDRKGPNRRKKRIQVEKGDKKRNKMDPIECMAQDIVDGLEVTFKTYMMRYTIINFLKGIRSCAEDKSKYKVLQNKSEETVFVHLRMTAAAICSSSQMRECKLDWDVVSGKENLIDRITFLLGVLESDTWARDIKLGALILSAVLVKFIME